MFKKLYEKIDSTKNGWITLGVILCMVLMAVRDYLLQSFSLGFHSFFGIALAYLGIVPIIVCVWLKQKDSLKNLKMRLGVTGIYMFLLWASNTLLLSDALAPLRQRLFLNEFTTFILSALLSIPLVFLYSYLFDQFFGKTKIKQNKQQ